MPRKANITDYIKIQGGRPLVTKGAEGLWHIVHAYRDDSPEIVTHISPVERGTIVIATSNMRLRFSGSLKGSHVRLDHLKREDILTSEKGKKYDLKLENLNGRK